jgi:3-isopropylmalate/(R)-2-methylmalate dehydratase small subunit
MMEPFVRVEGTAAPLPGANIDTDVIMPKIFLKGIDREGLARGLFHDLRFDGQGAPRPGFVLNQPGMADVRILVVGANFGCGSSREHAVWGLRQFGIRAIIGSSFAGIFADNAANNGLLLINTAKERVHALLDSLACGPQRLAIDLERCEVDGPDGLWTFAIEQGLRRSLLLGLDRIGETLVRADAIRAFETAYQAESPWLAEDARE